MLDRFHETYPEVGLNMMLHFEHPDEILAKDENGAYIRDEKGFLQWIPATGEAMRGLVSRGWLTVQNQAPIIKGINDDPDALRILQREFKRAGGENHYFFCGRDIVAYKAFNIPIERAWQILTESQRGLSGTEKHARLSITHYKGKTEVAAVTDKPIPGLKGAENGVVIFKLLRNAADAPDCTRSASWAATPRRSGSTTTRTACSSTRRACSTTSASTRTRSSRPRCP
jgi:lysine 2,3-aminomutase